MSDKIIKHTGKKLLTKAQRSRLAKRVRSGEDIGKKGKGFEKVAKKAAQRYGSAEAGRRVAAAAMYAQQAKRMHEEVIEYLYVNGYADSIESAENIAECMGQDWYSSIVEIL